MKLKEILTNAILFATEKHANQTDRGGELYILHPLRVMINAKTMDEKIVSVLHDVKEDCNVTDSQLRAIGLLEKHIIALNLLTRKKDEDYLSVYIPRIKKNSLAKSVKILDLNDNMNLDRLKNITDKDLVRLEKYKKAKNILMN